jgi:hypothetical protein
VGYSELGIVNLAFGKIGVEKITQADWDTPVTQQAIDAKAVWPYIRDLVLEAKNWKFAKTRAVLDMRYEAPGYRYLYAYALPVDFLRIVKPTDNLDPPIYPGGHYSVPLVVDGKIYSQILSYTYPYLLETLPIPSGLEKLTNGSFTGASAPWTLGAGWAYAANQVSKAIGNVNTLSQIAASMVSAPVVGELYQLDTEIVHIAGGSLIPTVAGVEGSPISTEGVKTQTFLAESAALGVVYTPSSTDLECEVDNAKLKKLTDRLCLITDYDDASYPLYLNYVKRITDCSRYPSTFIDALACRLGAELATIRTESSGKKSDLMVDYRIALMDAEALNQASDYLPDETGNDDWETAGR